MEQPMTSPILRAEARVALAGPIQMMDKLCDHFIEHGKVDRSERSARVVFEYGSASVEADDSRADDVRLCDHQLHAIARWQYEALRFFFRRPSLNRGFRRKVRAFVRRRRERAASASFLRWLCALLL